MKNRKGFTLVELLAVIASIPTGYTIHKETANGIESAYLTK